MGFKEVGGRIIVLSQQKKGDSMTNTGPHVIEVQYCRSCETHSWCTHHDEAKYHDTFLKLSELIAQRHPEIQVIGNMVPSHLIPFKIAQNKYIDSQTNKYVLYPQIGSFEVLLDGVLIFSKKQQNGWPHLSTILNRISSTLDPSFIRPSKESPSCSPRKKESNSPRKIKQIVTPSKAKFNDIHMSHDQKKTVQKQPAKGFTLTDHFKLYRPKYKYEEKDWQTEKYESETSSKQLSEFGRTESREKSEIGDSNQVILRDLSGETKLKEMLRSRGLLVKDQGRRQMIIKLDSIEEENAYDDNNITQRTADKHHKTSKIQELQDAFSSLQNKFINFQTKVQDIHTRKQEFELKGSPEDSNKKKAEMRREDSHKQQEKGLPSFEKPYHDKPSKLEQYLSASQQEKNEKLHRIYGEWKLLKQTAKKNKRMLKQKKSPYRQDEESDEDTSLSNSQSSANIIAFKPKKGVNPMQQHIQTVLQKGHKMSAIEHYQPNSQASNQPRFKTEQHFYHGHVRKQKVTNDDVQEESLPVARLFKNNTNTMSLQNMRTALRQSNPKLLKTQQNMSKQQHEQVSKFSHNARQSINKIQARMNKLQQQLSHHKENQDLSPQQPFSNKHTTNHNASGRKKGKSISQSSESSSSSYQHFIHQKQQSRGKKESNPQRNIRQGSQEKNHRQASQQKVRLQRNSYNSKAYETHKATSKKINHSRFTNNSQTTHKHQPSYLARPESFAIEEESEPRDSNINTKRSNKHHEHNPSNVSSRTTQNNKKPSHLPPKPRGQKLHSQTHPRDQPLENLEKPQFLQQERDQNHQKSSRLRKHELHEPVTFLRKQKDWKQSELKAEEKSQRHSEMTEEGLLLHEPLRHNKVQSSYSNKKSHASNYSSRVKNATKSKSKFSKSPRKEEPIRKVSKAPEAQNQKRSFGRIKKNKKKPSQHSTLRQEDASEETARYEERSNSPYSQGSADGESRKQTGRIVSHPGNKRILKYYRSEDYCYDGKSSRHANINSQDDSCEEEEARSGHRVQGWVMHSEEEGSECQFEDEREECDEPEQVSQGHVGNSNESCRRNSLDKELDSIRNTDELEVNNGTVLVSPQHAETKDKVSSQHSESRKADSIHKEEKKAKGTKKNSKSKRQKKQKKAKKSAVPKQALKEQAQQEKKQANLDELICKQYSEFLIVKVAHQLTKEDKATKESIQKEVPPTENNSYDNQEINVKVNYCQSIESIEAPVQEPPTSFMVFEPELPQENAEVNEANNQAENDEEENQQNESEYEQQDEEESQSDEDEQDQVEKDEQEDMKESQKEQRKDTNVQNHIIAGGAVITEGKAATSPKVEQTVQKVSQQRMNAEDKVLQQCDNVYSQAQPAKFRQIGIQKELTIEMSVQTEAAPDGIVVVSRKNSAHSHRSNSQRQQTFKKTQGNKTASNFYRKNSNQHIERANIIPKIYSNDVEEQIYKFTAASLGEYQSGQSEEGKTVSACEAYPEGLLMKDRSLELQLIATKHTNILKTLDILCEKSEWLVTRLFEDKNGVLKDKVFGVWLCKDYKWQCFVLDDKFKVDEQEQLLYSKHQGNQMWFNVLEKALATALGGYEALQKADSSLLFTMLTGCNAISSKIKEDPSKSGKLLQLIADCLRKNYIIHAIKNYDKGKAEGRESVYYINSIRKSGEDTLIEMSQDGCESFWVKLTKFIQEFGKIDILQLRVNHYFAHLDLGIPHPGQLMVVQLDFHEEGQGCVTLTSPGDCGPLRVFLYRQEKSKLLKLVGQAKEKNKSSLFFECNFTEGKYYVFAQGEEKSLRLAFIGQTQPSISMTQEIHSEGLKNEMAEYLPVDDKEESKLRRTEQEWGIRSSKARLRDNFFQSRLRENFVDYVLGRSKRA